MGQRHNRKRTRSRPRHRDRKPPLPPYPRGLSFQPISFTNVYSAPPQSFLANSAASHSAAHWDQQYSAWQDRLWQQHQAEESREAERLRMFGGEAGDEVSLCEPMLRVVMHLFNGIDYEDP